jgi:hypothetical protein
MKIHLRIELADELAGEFMQAIRDFDTKHDPGHENKVKVEMMIESDWPAEQMAALLQAVKPAPAFTVIKRFDS